MNARNYALLNAAMILYAANNNGYTVSDSVCLAIEMLREVEDQVMNESPGEPIMIEDETADETSG